LPGGTKNTQSEPWPDWVRGMQTDGSAGGRWRGLRGAVGADLAAKGDQQHAEAAEQCVGGGLGDGGELYAQRAVGRIEEVAVAIAVGRVEDVVGRAEQVENQRGIVGPRATRTGEQRVDHAG